MLVVIGRGTRHLTGQNWILLAGEILKTGFGTFLMIFCNFRCFLIIFSGLGVVAAQWLLCQTGTIGRGPLGHPVSSDPVSRLSGTREAIIQGKFCENLKVLLMGELCTLS